MSTNHEIKVTASGGKYFLDGIQAPALDLISGHTYIFDLSDSSLSTHPFRIKLNGTPWNDNVVINNSTLSLKVPSASLGTLSYYCTNHTGMGNNFGIVPNQVDGDDQNNTIQGSDGDDVIQGLNGDDVIRGGDGNDTLHGGAGEDKIGGGFGSDILTGGADGDHFIFDNQGAFGDTITDFEPSVDKITLTGALNNSNLSDKTFADVINFIQSSGDTIIQMSPNATAGDWVTVATLQNIQSSSLSNDDFQGLENIGNQAKLLVKYWSATSNSEMPAISNQEFLFSSANSTVTVTTDATGALGAQVLLSTTYTAVGTNTSAESAISVSDVIATLKAAVGITELTNYQELTADVNQDDQVTVSDVISVLKIAVGIEEGGALILTDQGNDKFAITSNTTELTAVALGDVDGSWADTAQTDIL